MDQEPDRTSLRGSSGKRSALILAAKNMLSTPRVLKEIDWLRSAGYDVATFGHGLPPQDVQTHYQLPPSSTFIRYLSYFIRSPKVRFWLNYARNLGKLDSPPDLKEFDLLVVHEPTLFPWTELSREMERRRGIGVHIDFHEDHTNSLSRTFLERVVFEKYRRWEWELVVRSIGLAQSATISSCSNSISKRISAALSRSVVTIRNSAPRRILPPREPHDQEIRLVHHGVGTRDRGIESYVKAMRKLPTNFSLTLMLVAPPLYKLKLWVMIYLLGIQKRVTMKPPVPTKNIPEAVNEFDLSLMVIPPVTENERLALPNKFFESVQARVGVITGPNPDMRSIVETHNLGIVLPDWSLAEILKSLLETSRDQIISFKESCEGASLLLSSEPDKRAFIALLKKHLAGS